MGETIANKLAEGKTKIIWEAPISNEVIIESKDDITAGDGARHDIMMGKAALANRTTVNCFKLLEHAGIPNHFVAEESETSFRAKLVTMIPVELVGRRLAFGSYLKRNPAVQEGQVFDNVVIEFFHKDDSKHDPLLLFDPATGGVRRYDAKQPVSLASMVDEMPSDRAAGLMIDRWPELAELTRYTFAAVEAAWAEQNVTLVDMKIECGLTADGQIKVSDVIDNDSWRIWPNGDVRQMKDKQVYRDSSAPLADIVDNYAWVADATARFTAA